MKFDFFLENIYATISIIFSYKKKLHDFFFSKIFSQFKEIEFINL